MNYQVNKVSSPKDNTKEKIEEEFMNTSFVPPSSDNVEEEEDAHVINMNFGNQSKIKALPNDNKKKKDKKEVPKSFNYVYAILYEGNMKLEDAQKFVEIHLKPIASTARVTYLDKQKQFLLWVQDKESDKIQKLIQTVLDNDKYIYVNDGSDVIFRPGMTYNQLNHQRIQLMNYRCFLDNNDPKEFRRRVRPIFLNKGYWITDDGKEFAEVIKKSFTKIENKGLEKSKGGPPKVEFSIDHMMIRKWIEKGLVYAQYESLKYKKQDFERLDQKDVMVGKGIKKLNQDIKEMRKIYKFRLKEWKMKMEFEEKKFNQISN